MQSFTTQSHQRNYQGNVVMPQPQARTTHKRHKILTGITTTIMALAIAVTGGLWGATAIHNQKLKNEVQTLRVQATQVAPVTEQTAVNPQAHEPRTLELRPGDANIAINEIDEDERPREQVNKLRHPKRAVKPQKQKTDQNTWPAIDTDY